MPEAVERARDVSGRPVDESPGARSPRQWRVYRSLRLGGRWEDLGLVRADTPWEAIVTVRPEGDMGDYRAYPQEGELEWNDRRPTRPAA